MTFEEKSELLYGSCFEFAYLKDMGHLRALKFKQHKIKMRYQKLIATTEFSLEDTTKISTMKKALTFLDNQIKQVEK